MCSFELNNIGSQQALKACLFKKNYVTIHKNLFTNLIKTL